MLAACGDTWSGMKEDTGENMEAVGDTVSKAGEDVKKDAERNSATALVVWMQQTVTVCCIAARRGR